MKQSCFCKNKDLCRYNIFIYSNYIEIYFRTAAIQRAFSCSLTSLGRLYFSFKRILINFLNLFSFLTQIHVNTHTLSHIRTEYVLPNFLCLINKEVQVFLMTGLKHLCQTSGKHKGERTGQCLGCLKNAQRSGKEFRGFRSVSISLLTPLESGLGLWEQFISTLNKSACCRTDHYSLVIYKNAYWWIAVWIFSRYKGCMSFSFGDEQLITFE